MCLHGHPNKEGLPLKAGVGTCRQVALGMPTSARVATAWRLSDDSDTWSKSTSRIRPTPERSSRCAAWLPTPCAEATGLAH